MEWFPVPANAGGYIRDERLSSVRKSIFVTYETGSGRRYVKQVECYHGRINKKIDGRVVAWGVVPEPYRGGA